jgi:hypothetical protein
MKGREDQQDDDEGEANLLGAEENRRPEKIQCELPPPELHRPSAAVALPDAPPGDGDQNIEHRPHRPEQPSRRIKSGLGKPRIPIVARWAEALQRAGLPA